MRQDQKNRSRFSWLLSIQEILKRPNCVNFIHLEHPQDKTSPEIFHVRIAQLENKLLANYTKHSIIEPVHATVNLDLDLLKGVIYSRFPSHL